MAEPAATPPGAVWDEDQCKASLAQLEGLHEQLDDLRLAIHSILHPLSAPQTDKALLFSAFKQATVSSQNGIKAFTAQWHSEAIKSIFEHTKESLQASADLAPSAQVPQYGWRQVVQAEKEAAQRQKDSGPKIIEEVEDAVEHVDVAQTLDDFKKAYPRIKVETKDDNRDLTIAFVALGQKFTFRVVVNPEANGRDKLGAECLGPKKATVITGCIASRPRANDLKYLLEMIAAYKIVKKMTCAKCDKLLNASQEALARRSRQVVNENGTSETVWEAFHPGCLD